jgi:hypothetical protein
MQTRHIPFTSVSTETVDKEVGHIPSIARYERALRATICWLLRSIEHGRGGSCAYYGIWGYWSTPYPETTGYLIPTLLAYADRAGDGRVHEAAIDLGGWLLDIQQEDGYWHKGKHPPRQLVPSVFNTAQILQGLTALYRVSREERWLAAAHRGARWLARGVDHEGQWSEGHYRSGFNPSYYTRVAWPMLDVWDLTRDSSIRDVAERVLRAILLRRRENGTFDGWGFAPDRPAYTHTIAYTLRGLIESADLLGDWPTYGRPAEAALERLFRQAERSGGRLAGGFDADWRKVDRYSCLTGNVQTALCLLRYEAHAPDLRLVNAACKLVDFVCASQSLRHPIPGIRGGVAGSHPIWGRYMFLRYPNWAAKFHGDALMALIDRLQWEEA